MLNPGYQISDSGVLFIGCVAMRVNLQRKSLTRMQFFSYTGVNLSIPGPASSAEICSSIRSSYRHIRHPLGLLKTSFGRLDAVHPENFSLASVQVCRLTDKCYVYNDVSFFELVIPPLPKSLSHHLSLQFPPSPLGVNRPRRYRSDPLDLLRLWVILCWSIKRLPLQGISQQDRTQLPDAMLCNL